MNSIERRMVFWVGVTICAIGGAGLSSAIGHTLNQSVGGYLGLAAWGMIVGGGMMLMSLYWHDRWRDS